MQLFCSKILTTSRRMESEISWRGHRITRRKCSNWNSSWDSREQSEPRDDNEDVSSLSDVSDFQHDNNDTSDGERCAQKAQERLRDTQDSPSNQADDIDEKSCSSLSLDPHDLNSISSNESDELEENISLSISTNSGDAMSSIDQSSSCESSSSSLDMANHVLLSEDEATRTPVDDLISSELSSLSGDMSDNSAHHSSIEFQFLSDDNSQDDELWREFETAIRQLERPAPSPDTNTPSAARDELLSSNCFADNCTTQIDEDEGYDASASELESLDHISLSRSSIDESKTRTSEVEEKAEVESDCESSWSSSSFLGESASSSLSPLSSSSRNAASADSDGPLSPLSGSDDDRDTKRREVENIPIKLRPVDPGNWQFPPREVEIVAHWREGEVFDAASQWRRGSSAESLALESDEISSFSEQDAAESLRKTFAQDRRKGIIHHELGFMEWYVPFSDLSGVLEQHNAGRNGVCLDFGCGTSRVCEELVYLGRRHVVGIDASREVIEFQRRQPAATHLHDYLWFIPMNPTDRLLFPDMLFDLIISKATLDAIAGRGIHTEYPHELVHALAELVRCLKPGGILLAVVNIVGLLDDEREIDGCIDRMKTPWWKWEEVQQVLTAHLSLVGQFEVGQPYLTDGIKEKPFRILVWRRVETSLQRASRLVKDWIDKRISRHEFQKKVAMSQMAMTQRCDEDRMIGESRQMILEDERSRQLRANELDVEIRMLREQCRLAFYQLLTEHEREQMAKEDNEGMHLRELFTEVGSVIYQTIDRAIESAASTTAAKVEETSQAQTLTIAHTALSPPKATVPEYPHSEWVRQLLAQLIEKAIRSTVSKGSAIQPTEQNAPQANIHPGPLAEAHSATNMDSEEIVGETLDLIISNLLSTLRIASSGSDKQLDTATKQSTDQDGMLNEETNETTRDCAAESSELVSVEPCGQQTSSTELPESPTAAFKPNPVPEINPPEDGDQLDQQELVATCSAALEAVIASISLSSIY